MRKPLPMMDARGVTVACQPSDRDRRGDQASALPHTMAMMMMRAFRGNLCVAHSLQQLTA